MDTYLAGVWKCDLLAYLLWYIDMTPGPNDNMETLLQRYSRSLETCETILPTYRAPSWSWANLDKGIHVEINNPWSYLRFCYCPWRSRYYYWWECFQWCSRRLRNYKRPILLRWYMRDHRRLLPLGSGTKAQSTFHGRPWQGHSSGSRATTYLPSTEGWLYFRS